MLEAQKASTRHTYHNGVNQFLKLASKFSFNASTSNNDFICNFVSLFVGWLVQHKLAFSTVKVYLFAVSAFYKDMTMGAFDPCASFVVSCSIAGACNLLASVPLSFMLEFFYVFQPKMDFSSYIDCRD